MVENDDEKASAVLRRIAQANHQPAAGDGLGSQQSDRLHFVPLAKYHSREVARLLSQRLEEHGIAFQTERSRMYVRIFVDFERREDAFRLLRDFQSQHADVKPRTISRDYDAVFVLAAVTAGCFVASFFVPAFNRLAPVAVLITGASLCIVVERWHRQYRYRKLTQLSIAEMFVVVFLFAVNLAIWRAVL